MNVEIRLESMLSDARAALAALATSDRTVSGLVDRIGAVRYSEGMLAGFLDALVLTDPYAAQSVTPRIEAFMSEAVAARILLD